MSGAVVVEVPPPPTHTACEGEGCDEIANDS